MIKEAEMKENAKIQAREIAKKRLEVGYKRDKMEAISSADYETEPAEKTDAKASPEKLRDLLSRNEKEEDSKKPSGLMNMKKAGPEKNSF